MRVCAIRAKCEVRVRGCEVRAKVRGAKGEILVCD